jgi:hypothetical protein
MHSHTFNSGTFVKCLYQYFVLVTVLIGAWFHLFFCCWLSEKLDLWHVLVPFLESTCPLYSVVFQIPFAKKKLLCFQDDFV